MDLNPEERLEEQEPEAVEGAPEAEEVSPEELAAAFGRPVSRWAVPAFIVVGVIGLALLFWKVGDDIIRGLSGEADTLKSAQEQVRVQTPAPPETTLAAPSARELKAGPPLSLPGAELDTATVDSTLLALLNDDFYMLLNAEVSPQESAALNDSAFAGLLFTPLIPQPEVPRPSLAIGETAGVTAGAPAPMPGAAVAMAVDTLKYLVAIDSLNREVAAYRQVMAKVHEDGARLEKQITRVTQTADSLKKADIRRLAKIVDTMEPAAAAAMLSSRSSDEIQAVLFRVKPRVAARIIENLPQPKRGQIAADIVGR